MNAFDGAELCISSNLKYIARHWMISALKITDKKNTYFMFDPQQDFLSRHPEQSTCNIIFKMDTKRSRGTAQYAAQAQNYSLGTEQYE